MNLESLKKKAASLLGGGNPMKRFLLIWIGVLGAILVVSVAVFAALLSKSSKLQTEVQGFRTRIDALVQLNVTAENMQDRMKEIRASAELEAVQYVTTEDIPGIIHILSRAATTNQIVLKKVNPLAAEDITGYPMQRIPIALQFEGDFANTGNFVSVIRTLIRRLYTIDQIHLAADAGRTGKVLSDMKIVFYARK